MRLRYVLPVALVLGLGIASFAVAATRDHHGKGNGKQNQAQFTAVLNGDNETPTLHSPATGTLTITQTSSTSLSYTLTYSGFTSSVLFAHVHLGEPAIAGGVTFFLCGGGGKPACPAGGGTVSGTVSAADILSPSAGGINQGLAAGDFNGALQELRNGAMYANVHTTNYPGGEIRGQLSSHGHGHGDDENDDD